MAHQKVVCMAMVSMIMIMMMMGATKAEISCGQVVNSLTPCITYVANGGTVPPRCCSGMKSLSDAAKTTPDRQGVCRCLKSALTGIPYSSFNLGLATGLPSKCGLNMPYKINPSADCNSVQ